MLVGSEVLVIYWGIVWRKSAKSIVENNAGKQLEGKLLIGKLSKTNSGTTSFVDKVKL